MIKKRSTIVGFGIIAIVIIIFSLILFFIERKQKEVIRPKVVVPNKKIQEENIDSSDYYTNTELENISLIQLNMDEILISTLSVDFNNDGYEDQVIGVKKTNNPNIVVIFGLYNSKKMIYERYLEIQTPISQTKTFGLVSMDLIGNHTNSLIFTGFAENNNSIMIAYAPKFSGTNFTLMQIVNLQTEGNIMIKRTTRSDNYSIYNANDVSFQILTNRTEKTEDGKNFNHIETVYDWKEKNFSYIEKTSTKVSSSRVAAKELARIQDGNINTFHAFLDGLWYKTQDKNPENADGDDEQSIFFNSSDKEIIISNNDKQGVYDWLSSRPRITGIFISGSNKSISNLVRYFYIDLISIDEIRIRITDDVRMIIGTEASWDGIYKKKVQKNFTPRSNNENSKININEVLEKDSGRWDFQNISVIFRDYNFTLTENGQTVQGVYTASHLHGIDLIQFRANSKKCKLNGSFACKQNTDRIDLIPVKITADSCVITGNSIPIRLEKYKTN
ncbi:MAG: pallilysin-related adhesin [Treponemataceae bacterium]